MNKPTADDVRKSSMITLANAHTVYVEAVRKTMGKKGLEVIGEENRVHGLELGKEGIRAGGLREGDLMSLYEFFDAAHPYFGFELEIQRHTDTAFELKVTACPWIDAFRAKGAGEDICEWVCKIDEGIGQAVDPDVHLTIPKCMMRGDDHCIYRWAK